MHGADSYRPLLPALAHASGSADARPDPTGPLCLEEDCGLPISGRIVAVDQATNDQG